MLLFITFFDTILKNSPQFSEQFFYLLSLINENLNKEFIESLGLNNISVKAFGIIGLINLAWSSRLIVQSLQRALDLIFSSERQRHAIMANFISLIIIPGVFLFILALTAFNFILNHTLTFLMQFSIIPPSVLAAVKVFAQFFPVILVFFSVYISYRFLPVNKPSARAAAKGTILFFISVFILKLLFSLFFSAAKLNFVYGLIGTVIVLLIWVYFVSVLFFFFASFAYVSDNVDVLLINKLLSRDVGGKIGFFEKRIFSHMRYIYEKYSKHFESGETIFNQNDDSKDIYFLIHGKAGVYINSDRKIAEIRSGEVFGEMSYLLDEPRTATIIAETNLSVMIISTQIFEELIDMNSRISKNIISLLSSRLKKADQKV